MSGPLEKPTAPLGRLFRDGFQSLPFSFSRAQQPVLGAASLVLSLFVASES